MEIKRQIYIIISVFVLTILFLSLFFIYPLLKEISKKSQELIMEKNSGFILETQFNEAINFKQKYEDYKLNLEKADALLLDPQNPVYFIEFLEKRASDLAIKLQISAPTPSKQGTMKYQNFQLSALGGFAQTLKFVRELEAGPFLIKVQKINIANPKGAKTPAEKEKVSADISIKVFSK